VQIVRAEGRAGQQYGERSEPLRGGTRDADGELSRLKPRVALALLVSCAAPGVSPAHAPEPAPKPASPVVHHLQDPDLNHPPPRKLLAIDWSATKLASDADALALWARIAPTGDDWEEKLAEVPSDSPIAHQLAIALLHEGNLTCAAPPRSKCDAAPLDLPAPADTATLTDPCLRRLLALWSIEQLDEDELPAVRDALRAIAAIPPPESQLVASAIRVIPERDLDGRYELIEIAWRAGQHELVDGMLGTFDDAHLVTAVSKLHVDGALAPLSAENQRATFLAAVTDEQLSVPGRRQAIDELVEIADAKLPSPAKLPADLRAALITAGKSRDCAVAAAAARALDQHGDRTLVPKVPHTRSPEVMMRQLCVLASFESMQRSDEPSYFPTYIAAKGLELVKVSYDPYSDSDLDGDGDVHTAHERQLVSLDEVVLPEVEDLVRAMAHCTGTACRSESREFRFTFRPFSGGLLLTRLEVAELPPCSPSGAMAP
jgi:hypothetical protein